MNVSTAQFSTEAASRNGSFDAPVAVIVGRVLALDEACRLA
jgi:hypothetical protein